MQLPTLLRPNLGGIAALSPGQAFTVLAVGSERELTRQVAQLLEDAGLDATRLIPVASVEAALARLATERPGIVFLAVGSLDMGNLSALVRLQAAAPGVPVVPLPMLTAEARHQAWLVADAGTPSCRPVGGGEPSAAAGTAR